MIDKEVLQEIVREAFQDFDLLDNYEYSINTRIGVFGTNKNGSITQLNSNDYKNYIDLYNNKSSRNGIVTYKDYIYISVKFKHSENFNKEQFDDFFEDGMVKLNSLLERYNIILPKEMISKYNGYDYYSFEILGEEKEIIVEFSSRLKNKSK